MGEPLKHVVAGETLVIRASTWNTLIDSAKDYQRRVHNGGANKPTQDSDPDIILVKNISGSDVDRFAVLGISTILFSPTDNLDGFKNNFCLSCTTPTTASHTGRFVITAEPIPNGKIGLAYASGVCPVQLLTGVGNFADVVNSDRTQLGVSPSGSAQVLYREAGSGTKWGIVRLGGGIAAATFLAKITAHATLTSASVTVGGGSAVTVAYKWKYAWTEMERTGDTVQVLSGGRSGTTTTDYAINEAEINHTSSFAWGQKYDAAPYPTGFRPKAVGGANTGSTDQSVHSYDVLVEMMQVVEVGSGLTKYRFNKEWEHSGSCS